MPPRAKSRVPQRPAARKPESVRDRLLSAATRLFAEKGFDGVSVKDLAEATGHNAALVNYYFKGKAGLYRECVMPLVGAGMASAERTLRAVRSRQDFLTRFELFTEDFVATHMRQQNLCVILHRDLHTDVVKHLFKEHFVHLCEHLRVFFDAARKRKILRQDLDPVFLTHAISGCIFQLITTDPFRSEIGLPVFLNEKRFASTVRQITTVFLCGLLQPEEKIVQPPLEHPSARKRKPAGRTAP